MNCTKDNYDSSAFTSTYFIVIYSLVFIIGLPENIAACFYLLHNTANKGLTEVKIYMINLTLADLMFILFLPFWVDYYNNGRDWRLSDNACGFLGSLFYINTYSTLCFLTLISFTRYLAVSRPLKTAQSKQLVRGIIVTAVIWTGTVGSSINTLITSSNHTNKRNDSKISCFEHYENKSVRKGLLAIHSIMVLTFAVLFGVVIANYILILRKLLIEKVALRLPQGKLKKRASRMVLMVLVIYILCFLPYHLIQLPWVFFVLDFWKSDDCNFRKRFNDLHHVTLGLMCMNCVLDPIVYCFLTEDFRQYLRELMGCLRNISVLKNRQKSQTVHS
ncbi:platelet-activating factor receptor-like [Hypanus sabinus]|uniref:platelet-activating factor receptor-like n=1 Tax=Hypanus sabinus TaxID=79690 RepID=UPI0028C4E5E5|nr:platelet-activating factor receptor-like [Hypanus sabinus]